MTELANKHFMVVDDSDISQRVLIRALQNLGVDGGRIRTAATVDEALKLWEEFDRENGVVFLDIVLPGKGGGFGLLEQFRGDSQLTRIIVLSSRSDRDTVMQAKTSGATYYLIKPFQLEKLKLALSK